MNWLVLICWHHLDSSLCCVSEWLFTKSPPPSSTPFQIDWIIDWLIDWIIYFKYVKNKRKSKIKESPDMNIWFHLVKAIEIFNNCWLSFPFWDWKCVRRSETYLFSLLLQRSCSWKKRFISCIFASIIVSSYFMRLYDLQYAEYIGNRK